MSEMKFRVFIVNVERLNNAVVGEDEFPDYLDYGEWFVLPIQPSELGKVVSERIGSSADGYQIFNEDIATGIECLDGAELMDCELWEVNADALDIFSVSLTDEDKFVVDALIDSGDYSVHDAVCNYFRFEIFDVTDEEDLGREIAERNGVYFDSDLDEYISWDDYANDNASEILNYDCKYVVKL